MLRSIINTIPFVGVNFNVRGFVGIDRLNAAYARLVHLTARLLHECTCLHSWRGHKCSMQSLAPAFVPIS